MLGSRFCRGTCPLATLQYCTGEGRWGVYTYFAYDGSKTISKIIIIYHATADDFMRKNIILYQAIKHMLTDTNLNFQLKKEEELNNYTILVHIK